MFRRLLVAVCLIASLAGLALGPSHSAAAATVNGPVVVVHYNADINELGKIYLRGALHHAASEHAQVVIIQFNTLGGLITSMQSMVHDIFASPVPVVVWIGPSGAGAASAGTFISAAASYLAMAPVTNIGAAAAVNSQGGNLSSTEAKKTNQFDAALMSSIAEKRHRPVAALRETIFKARAYSAEEAVRLGIANAEVSSLSALISKLDGQTLASSAGPKVVHTAGVPIKQVNPNLWERLLSFLSDPNLVFLLLSLGGLGLVVELWTGGNSWIPGSLGVIFLLAAFAGLSVLPFSWAGLALILFGIVLLGFELHAPGHVFFGASGTASMILGGIFLLGYFGSPGLPGYNPSVSYWVLISLGLIVGLLVLLMAREVHMSHHGKRYVSPLETAALVGAVAEASSRLEPKGEVLVGGESWQAELKGGGTAEPGERLKVVAVDGLRMIVEPLSNKKPSTKNLKKS
ncbi:MAG TPA: NfeD family protein [Gaiellaceae bacterium]